LVSPGRLIQEGDSVNLTCKVIEGLPDPQLSWYKNNVILPNKKKTTLILANVTDQDEGRYTCKAQNVAGSVTDSMYVTVRSKFIIIIMNISTII